MRPDGRVWFEGREYCVPFEHADRSVRVRSCVRTVEIYAQGRFELAGRHA